MKLLKYHLCFCLLCISTYAFSEEAVEPEVTEEVVVEAAPAVEETAEVVIEAVEEKVEEVPAVTE